MRGQWRWWKSHEGGCLIYFRVGNNHPLIKEKCYLFLRIPLAEKNTLHFPAGHWCLVVHVFKLCRGTSRSWLLWCTDSIKHISIILIYIYVMSVLCLMFFFFRCFKLFCLSGWFCGNQISGVIMLHASRRELRGLCTLEKQILKSMWKQWHWKSLQKPEIVSS